MFFHQCKYRIKYFLKMPTTLFWAFLFPVILGTLFRAGFGDALLNSSGMDAIPIAVVSTTDNDKARMMLDIVESVTFNDGNPIFTVTKTSDDEEAKSMLWKDDVSGIIKITDSIELITSGSSFNVNILKQFMDQYQRTEAVISDIMATDPALVTSAIATIQGGMVDVTKVNLGGVATNGLIQYFYALLAMTCMFGCYLGLSNSISIKASLSPIAARRCITPSHKMMLITADSSAAITVHFVQIILVWLYLRFILGIPIGSQAGYFLLTCFVGSVIGVCYGQFIGALGGSKKYSVKEAILTSSSLLLSFLSGLMIHSMKNIVEEHFPLLNRINPAALITDAFYSLSMFDDYSRYLRNLVTMIIIAACFMIGSFIILRRERYDSI